MAMSNTKRDKLLNWYHESRLYNNDGAESVVRRVHLYNTYNIADVECFPFFLSHDDYYHNMMMIVGIRVILLGRKQMCTSYQYNDIYTRF